jgi:hypothetical protein
MDGILFFFSFGWSFTKWWFCFAKWWKMNVVWIFYKSTFFIKKFDAFKKLLDSILNYKQMFMIWNFWCSWRCNHA